MNTEIGEVLTKELKEGEEEVVEAREVEVIAGYISHAQYVRAAGHAYTAVGVEDAAAGSAHSAE